MNAELQRAQDMLGAMQHQRDQALNANVFANAQILELQREVAALQKQVRQLTVEPVAPSEE